MIKRYSLCFFLKSLRTRHSTLDTLFRIIIAFYNKISRGGSRTAATSKMKHFVILINGWKPLIITKCSILNVAAFLDSPLLKAVIKLQTSLTNQGQIPLIKPNLYILLVRVHILDFLA